MTINERYKDIAERHASEVLRHDAARRIIECELLALQHECQHSNLKTWSDSGWGRMSSTERSCPDCGLRTST